MLKINKYILFLTLVVLAFSCGDDEGVCEDSIAGDYILAGEIASCAVDKTNLSPPIVADIGSRLSHFLDLNNDGRNDFNFEHFGDAGASLRSSSRTVVISTRSENEVSLIGGMDWATALNAGDTIDNQLIWKAGTAILYEHDYTDTATCPDDPNRCCCTSLEEEGVWREWEGPEEVHYLGIRISDGENKLYGWVKCSLGPFSLTIMAHGIENRN